MTLIISFALSNPIFSVHARCSGVTTECLEFDTTFLTVPFFCAIFALAMSLLMHLRGASFTVIYEIHCFSTLSETSKSVINTNIRLISWNMLHKLPLIRFLDIYATHASSLYGIFLSIVTFSGSHSTLPYVKTIREHVSSSWYYIT